MDIPLPLSAKYKESFAYDTIKDRLPVILTKVIDYVCRNRKRLVELSIVSEENRIKGEEETKEVIGRMSKFRNEMQTDKVITPLTSIGDDVEIWNQLLESYKEVNGCEPSWFTSSWLLAECYMYRRIYEAFQLSRYLKTFDPFEEQKQNALITSLDAMEILGQYLLNLNQCQISKDSLRNEFIKFLELSLWGNRCDLSISGGAQNSQLTSPLDELAKFKPQILVNDSQKLWDYIKGITSTNAPIKLDIILDNAGYELFTDLCFVEFLDISGLLNGGCVRFYVKRMPWFVSDTMTKDLHWVLQYLSSHECNRQVLLKLSSKWKKNFELGTWSIVDENYWTLPYDYSEMHRVDPHLYQKLSEANLIIFKGDLNYRKLVGDLQWNIETPFVTSLRGFLPSNLCALRTLKADVVTGLSDEHVLNRISNGEFPKNWMVSGDYAVVQLALR